ncbi:MAG TPA: sigma-70 family RNA polymerase sigma factor [Acidimicrobiales bacterium]|nr:sigma-70 family RNA polymerase sigma factor [Acidimicrobiales bacterium]
MNVWAATDDALLAGMAAGDADAAVAFVRRFQRRVYGLAYAVTNDATLADDIAQEAFVRAWKAAAVFDARRASVATWLLTITRNAAIDALRMRRATPSDPDALAAVLPPSAIGLADVPALEASDTARVRAAVASLPEAQRRAVLLAVVGGRTAAEVAEAESIPLGTAKTRIRQAMIRLRDQLASLSPNEEHHES